MSDQFPDSIDRRYYQRYIQSYSQKQDGNHSWDTGMYNQIDEIVTAGSSMVSYIFKIHIQKLSNFIIILKQWNLALLSKIRFQVGIFLFQSVQHRNPQKPPYLFIIMLVKKIVRLSTFHFFHLQQTIKYNFSIVKDLNLKKPIGKLSIVATPIGNLSDITPNILKCLFKADLIGCEDRRVAGQLYTLIKNRNLIQSIEQKFGTIGISNLVLSDKEEDKQKSQQTQDEEKKHQFYEYSNMSDKNRRKFLSKLSLQDEKKFKIDYLKYRATKIVNKNEQFLYKSKPSKYDELYGIQLSDHKYIEAQILSTRAKKGRGLLIPLNTYSETKMFDMVRNLLETKHVAIVSDAGMPCISDPGWRMVRMIRQTMPSLNFEVVGGPSSIDIMLTIARITSNQKTLSGRFEGFASPEISNMTEENITYNKSLRQAKEKDFSIHFINSKKLKKNVYQLQRIYGQEHRIVLANELTKKFERKFHGKIKSLINNLNQEKKEFDGKGQMSYLLYPGSMSENNKIGVQSSEENVDLKNFDFKDRVHTVDVNHFVRSLQKTDLKAKQKANLVSTIFNLKQNQSKNIVYENTLQGKK